MIILRYLNQVEKRILNVSKEIRKAKKSKIKSTDLFKPYSKDDSTKKLNESSTTEREKRYTCKHCKEYYYLTAQDYAFRAKTAAKQTCGAEDCLSSAAMQYITKSRAAKKKQKKKQDDDEREKLKTLTAWKDDLQKPINWIVKELDKERLCISHPELKSFLRYDAGHYYSIGTCSDLRFNFHNIHAQSSWANQKHGGCPEYLEGLIDRYGQEYGDYVQGLKRLYAGVGKEKYTIDNIKNIYLPIARRLQREMKKGAMFSRTQLNEMIGIY